MVELGAFLLQRLVVSDEKTEAEKEQRASEP